MQRKINVYVASGGAVHVGADASGGEDDEDHGVATIYICRGKTGVGWGSAFGVG